MQLVSTNIAGNLHSARNTINKMGLAAHVLAMDYAGSATVVVFKVPNRMAKELRLCFGTSPQYAENPTPQRNRADSQS